MVSKVYPMRSHTVSAEGGAAGVAGERRYASTNIATTRFPAATGSAIRTRSKPSATKCPRNCCSLEHWGCPWSREPDGRIAVRPFGGMKKMRTWFAADKTGFHMLHTLFQTSLQFSSITRYDEVFATRLLVEDGAIQGVVAIELRTGKVRAIQAKAVIICTGGCGRVFPFTTNANICTGDGMALAYRAGAPLKDMEMVAVPSDRPALHRHSDHGGGARRGRLAAEQGRLPLSAGLRPGQADADAGAAQHGAGTARPRVAGDIRRVREGPRVQGPLWRLRASRSAPSGRAQDRVAAADGARAVPQVRESRSGQGADSASARCSIT